jgi:glycosyltransferase involved in cell wall biosynthesis
LEVGLLYSSLRGFNAVDGGIAVHFAELAAGLAAAGAAVRVFVVAESVPPSVPRTAEGYEIVSLAAPLPSWLHRAAGRPWQLHALTGLWFRSRAAARLVLTAHRERPLDVVETSSSGLLAYHLCHSRHRPRLVTRVSTTAEQLVAHNSGLTGWHTRLESAAERRLVRRSDIILTHTHHHRDIFCRAWALPAERVALIPHGLALPPAAALHAASPDAPPTLLYVGRFEHRKGIDTLLAALPSVLARFPHARAILAGSDTQNYWQNKFCRENPGLGPDRVSFLGRIDAATLAAHYRTCAIFVGPSRYESFGLIYVEAMSWARPVVACGAGGVPEVVVDGETGLLVTPGDVDGLARALARLLDDSALRQNFGLAGRQRAEALFSREAMARASLALYSSPPAA